jgi:hypothetical protein
MKHFGFLISSKILLIIFIFINSAESQMIADVTSNIQTEFGIYHPYLINITPAAETYSVESDFNNVANFQSFASGFNQNDLALLQTNAFVIKPTQYKEIFDVYKDCKENEIPIFVTTDAMLHTFHIIYDYALRALEVQQFAPDLENLNQVLLTEMERIYHATSDANLKQIVLKNVAYFAVASKLKNDLAAIPTCTDSLVESELALIAAHQGFDCSPIFNSEEVQYLEDYSQYVPRGHYSRNDTLSTYFKAMMWYGRMMFRVEPDTTEAGKQKGKEETLQAILIVRAINELTVNGEPALTVWERIYDPTVFFVGKSDDLDIYDYTNLIEEVYGNDYLSLTVADLANDEKLTKFVEKAKELEDPLISSSWVWDDEEAEQVTKGFRFMGQRFIPDSYMFQQLVYNKVWFYQGSGNPFTLVYSDAGPIRGFPRGLDVMAVLGSQAAEAIIQAEGDAEYTKYDQQLNKLKEEFATLDDAVWVQNLYWNWLYSLMPLLEPKGAGYPTFMQTLAWVYKQLYAALASWGELRHDTILYAKQSYTSETTCMPPQIDFTYGYVEPNPHLFARLASLTNLMRVGLSGRGLLLTEFDTKLINFESLLLGLKGIAEKELTNQELLPEEYNLIWTIGERLENLLTFSEELIGATTDETDEGMAVIADVHTDGNSSQVLEEGVGYPFEIYVIVKLKGNLVMTRGGGFSYYEFKHPMNDRLTDEAWQAMLKGANPPALPQWTGAFIDHEQNFTITHPHHALLELETVSDVNVQINPASPTAGSTIELKVEAYYYDSPLTATFYNQEGTNIDSLNLIWESAAATRGNYIGNIATSNWSGGTIMVKILYNEYILATHWFELLKASGINTNKSKPRIFSLAQNYPNPFNPMTTIKYQLPVTSYLTIKVYNLLGKEVATLFEGVRQAGNYSITFDGGGLAAGVYIYQLKAGNFVETKKFILLK